jgi:hypothetical protein
VTRARLALLIAIAAALAVDALVFASFPVLRAIISRQHWILYAYLSAIAGIAAGGATLLVAAVVGRARQPTRS